MASLPNAHTDADIYAVLSSVLMQCRCSVEQCVDAVLSRVGVVLSSVDVVLSSVLMQC